MDRLELSFRWMLLKWKLRARVSEAVGLVRNRIARGFQIVKEHMVDNPYPVNLRESEKRAVKWLRENGAVLQYLNRDRGGGIDFRYGSLGIEVKKKVSYTISRQQWFRMDEYEKVAIVVAPDGETPRLATVADGPTQVVYDGRYDDGEDSPPEIGKLLSEAVSQNGV